MHLFLDRNWSDVNLKFIFYVFRPDKKISVILDVYVKVTFQMWWESIEKYEYKYRNMMLR